MPHVNPKLMFNIIKPCTRVAALVAKRLKNQNIKKSKENLKIGRTHMLVPHISSRAYFLAIAPRTYAKADIDVFLLFGKHFVIDSLPNFVKGREQSRARQINITIKLAHLN